MPSAVLYFGSSILQHKIHGTNNLFHTVVLAAQIFASIGVFAVNCWMVKFLMDIGFPIDHPDIGTASFYCLIAISALTVVIPVIQGILMGCLCCGGCIGRPLSRGHYTAQSIFLGLQAVAWIAAAGWGTSFLIVNELVLLFGNVQYLSIVCSWIAPYVNFTCGVYLS